MLDKDQDQRLRALEIIVAAIAHKAGIEYSDVMLKPIQGPISESAGADHMAVTQHLDRILLLASDRYGIPN
jgi:hypothetical protein